MSLCLLGACATRSSPPPAEPPAAKAVDPRVCAALTGEPRLPDEAGIPQPVGATEQAASETFLNWVAGVLDWGRVSAHRAMLARNAVCPHQ